VLTSIFLSCYRLFSSQNKLPLSILKFLPWSIYGSSHDDSVRKGILVNPTNAKSSRRASQYYQGLRVRRTMVRPWWLYGAMRFWLCLYGTTDRFDG